MATPVAEIIVDDPTAPADNSPPVLLTRTVDVITSLLLCLLTQWLGLYVASFLLIAGFMRLIGRIALWKSLLTAFLFAIVMFVTFDVAFDVIMPKGPLEAAFGY